MPATPRDLSYLIERHTDPDLRDRLLFAVQDGITAKLVTPGMLEAREPPLWYMERFVPEDGLTILYGPPKKGKTFLSMEWAFRMARGESWQGYKVDRKLKVLYLAAEGLGSLGERQKALRERRNWPLPKNLMWMTGSRHLYTQNGASPQLQELYASVERFRPHVVFVDTLARHSPGGNVSDNHDMQLVVDRLDQIRQAWGCSFVLVHHTRRGDNEFIGAQALFGSTDVMVELRPDGATFSLHVESRDWEDHHTPFKLMVQPVREDAPGWATVEDGGRFRAGAGTRQDQVNRWRAEYPSGTVDECQMALWGKKGKDVYAYWVKEEEADTL